MDEVMPNVLADRYAGEAMVETWSPHRKIVLERKLWVAVLRAQRDLGVDVPEGVIDDHEAVLHVVDLDSIAAREAVTRHDVKARIDEFGALAGHQQIHRAMTSRDVTENIEQLQIRDALVVVRSGLVTLLARLADMAEAHAGLAMVARTHNVAAQVSTLGKRFADSIEELLLGYARIDQLIERYPLRGIKGPVGTRLDQLDLLGDAAAVDELEVRIASALGFDRVLDSVGQVYPRSLDLDVVAALVQAVSAPASLASTIRLMAGRELVSEGFRPGQVGSSAMPHKVNARSCERVAALRTVLDGHLAMAASLAGGQWNEGDVSCSAARRVMLPDAFFAADGLIQTILGVLEDLEVFPAMIAAELDRDLPLLATTRFLGAAVEAGLGREDAHELIRHHSVTAARARREGGPETGDADLVGRLADDPRFPLDRDVLERVLEDRSAYTGTAEVQIGRVVGRAREIVARHPAAARARARTRV